MNGFTMTQLAKEYGTPLYVMDADRIRRNVRAYIDSAKKHFGENAHMAFASKACSFTEMYRIVGAEGMYIDVVSPGEIATAKNAGYPLEKAYFHSCNKSDEDIEYAINNGIGYFVVDNEEELFAIEAIAAKKGMVQKILIRLTPGIDPHTFAQVATGKIDSKFGFGIETGLAEDVLAKALKCEHVKLMGFHCHVGSQVFESDVYMQASDKMLDFIKLAKDKYGYVAEELDLGGGYGVRYLEEQPTLDVEANISALGAYLKDACAKRGLTMPGIGLEPGRSIVADAGLTLYTVGSVKKIPGFINYVSVDGGMTDNVRYAMYGSKYTVVSPEKMNSEWTMTASLVGRCCESGDIIQPGVQFPADLKRGDLVAVLTTGAYNYSMASNYNRVPRPAVVMLSRDGSYVAVKRESLEDICSLDK